MAAGLLSSEKSLTDDEVLVKELMIITIDNLVKEHLNLDSKADLVPILRIIMEAIEDKKFTGSQQKELAMLVLQTVVDKSDLEIEQKKEILDLINSGIITNTIQLVSDASKGKLNINKKVAKESLIACLIGCLTSFNTKKQEEEKEEVIPLKI